MERAAENRSRKKANRHIASPPCSVEAQAQQYATAWRILKYGIGRRSSDRCANGPPIPNEYGAPLGQFAITHMPFMICFPSTTAPNHTSNFGALVCQW